ncbi:MAG: M56 family metallopeptidase [Prevotellaceae bacterium]|jgi:hypothetical protein|nr:M56 family metallopeptidase [Prevotellaceae bacterium]
MTSLLVYFLKINVALALFYAFYRLFFNRDTFFKGRRVLLLLFFVVAAIYPLVNLQDRLQAEPVVMAAADIYAVTVLPETPAFVAETLDWKDKLPTIGVYLYIGVLVALFLRLLIQFGSIIRLHHITQTEYIKGVRVQRLRGDITPFSFFGWIFINPDLHSDREIGEILTHERTHVRQWHSLDVIAGELFCIACWFNPFAWLLCREVRTNLEFLADNYVLTTGYDQKTYQYHLLGLAHRRKVATLTNNFNVLPLKKRIKMMNRKRTTHLGTVKYLAFVPLAALLLVASNIEALARGFRFHVETPLQSGQYEYRGVVLGEDGKPVKNLVVFYTPVSEDAELQRVQQYNDGISIGGLNEPDQFKRLSLNDDGTFSVMSTETIGFVCFVLKDGYSISESQTYYDFVKMPADQISKVLVYKLWATDANRKDLRFILKDSGVQGFVNFRTKPTEQGN